MRVISDNIANSTTIGYKAHRSLFAPLVTGSRDFSGVATSSGITTTIQRLQNVQGATTSTQSATDLALSGEGFLVLADSAQATDDRQLYYSRSDGFVLDNEGYLVSPTGSYLQGWRTDPDGNILATQLIESVQITNRLSARATSQVGLGANLKAGQELYNFDTGLTEGQNFDLLAADPELAAYSISNTLYDSEGRSHDVNLSFIKKAQNTWNFIMGADGGDVVGGTPGTNQVLTHGTIFFNPNGSLKYVDTTQFDVEWSGGVEVATIDLDFGDYTGGYLFDETTTTGAMTFTDGIIAATLDDSHPQAPAIPLGTYSFAGLATGELEVTEPDGSTFTAMVSTLPTERSVTFGNGLTLTLDDAWVHPGATAIGTIDVILQDPLGDGLGVDGVVQFSSDYNPYSLSQNGFASGTLNDIQITNQGDVEGFFTNGETRSLWKLPIAVFNAPQFLDMTPDNRYRETNASGDPFYKVAGDGAAAQIVSYALEQSTVDIATEFTSMIVTQRAYQANSKAITTVDQMLAELMNIR